MKTSYSQTSYDNCLVVEWSGMNSGEGSPLDCEFLEPISVFYEGDFDGAEVVMEGSVKMQFFPLIGAGGEVICASSEIMQNMTRNCITVRPRIINGSDKTNVSVLLLCNVIPKRRLGR